MDYDRTTRLVFSDRPEEIWVLSDEEGIHSAYSTEQGAGVENKQHKDRYSITPVTLHRPSLAPIYGGPTLLEALWSRMDDHMEALMTGQQGEDTAAGARELAWVIAIVTNAYAPSMDKVREEAMRRWQAAEAEAAAQEETLNPDEKDEEYMTRPEGADQ